MYCRNCANAMDFDGLVCPVCGTAAGGGVNYCPECGRTTAPEDKHCSYCGHDLQEQKRPRAKSRILAGMLGILLGTFGVHNFYLGFTGKAMAQLMITLISLGTLAFISTIWGLVEGIRYLKGTLLLDGNNNLLK